MNKEEETQTEQKREETREKTNINVKITKLENNE